MLYIYQILDYLSVKFICSLSWKDQLDRGNSPACWQILRFVVIRGGLCEVDVVDLIEELMLNFLVAALTSGTHTASATSLEQSVKSKGL